MVKPFQVQSFGTSVPFSLTRKNDTTPYNAGDVIGPESGTSAFELANIGPEGGLIFLVGASLEIDRNSIPSGMTSFNLELYGVTPPSALVDNAQFDIPSGDRSVHLRTVSLGTPIDKGSTLKVDTEFSPPIPVKLTGSSLSAYLVTVAGFTDAAQTVYSGILHAVPS